MQAEDSEAPGTVPLPTPEALPTLDVQAIVDTGNQRANVRSGPGTEFPIVAKGQPDTVFDVVGRDESGEWWQICCVTADGDPEGEATTVGWLADSIVIIEGDADEVPVFEPLLADDVESEWRVEWECGSERCEVAECKATVTAAVDGIDSAQWLQLDHSVLWDDGCFPEDAWTFEVNQYTANERGGTRDDNFLYGYWLGAQPGEANTVYELESGEQVAAWCSGPHEVDIDEGDGWRTVYEGETCHDARTGMLLSLSYEKRWLFTGEFNGETYEDEYFGDFETLEQNLVETTVELSYLDD